MGYAHLDKQINSLVKQINAVLLNRSITSCLKLTSSDYLPLHRRLYNSLNFDNICIKQIFLKFTIDDMIVLIKGINCPCPSPHTCIKSLKLYNIFRVESDLMEACSNCSDHEVSCHDKNFVPCPMRFSCAAQGLYRENKAVRENWRVKMFAVEGYHTVICDAFI